MTKLLEKISRFIDLFGENIKMKLIVGIQSLGKYQIMFGCRGNCHLESARGRKVGDAPDTKKISRSHASSHCRLRHTTSHARAAAHHTLPRVDGVADARLVRRTWGSKGSGCGSRWQWVLEIWNLMGFYSIRIRVWVNFSTMALLMGKSSNPTGLWVWV